jgi:hypothetical protein
MDKKSKLKRNDLFKKAKDLGYEGQYRTSKTEELIEFINQKRETKKRKRTEQKVTSFVLDSIDTKSMDMKKVEREIKQSIQNLSAQHCVEMKFNMKYNFLIDSLQRISRQLLTTLIETVPFAFSFKIILFGDLINTGTGERISDFPCYFPKDRMLPMRTTTEKQKSVGLFNQYIMSFTECEEIYPSTKWTYDVVRSIGFKICKQYQGG